MMNSTPKVVRAPDAVTELVAVRQRLERACEVYREAQDVSALGEALAEVWRMLADFEGRVRQGAVEALLVQRPPGWPTLEVELYRFGVDPKTPDEQRTLAIRLAMYLTSTEALRVISANPVHPDWIRDYAARMIASRTVAAAH